MTPTEIFQRAPDALLRYRDDLERARAEFRWPELADFNWAWDWFEVLAANHRGTALVVVSEATGVRRVSYAELAERSTRLGRWLSDPDSGRADRCAGTPSPAGCRSSRSASMRASEMCVGRAAIRAAQRASSHAGRN